MEEGLEKVASGHHYFDFIYDFSTFRKKCMNIGKEAKEPTKMVQGIITQRIEIVSNRFSNAI